MTTTGPHRRSGVEYSEVEPAYFEERRLRRHARVASLWALGVGAVISGDFFGWNFGLGAGGFGGLLIATFIITVMYAGLCFSNGWASPFLSNPLTERSERIIYESRYHQPSKKHFPDALRSV